MMICIRSVPSVTLILWLAVVAAACSRDRGSSAGPADGGGLAPDGEGLGHDSASPGDAAVAGDATALDPDAANLPSSDRCAAAAKITLTAGKAVVKGDTSGATNEFGDKVECGNSPKLAGPQVYYQVALTEGQTYLVTLQTLGWSGYLYIVRGTSCDPLKISAACSGADGATAGSWGETAEIQFQPGATDTYVIAVDSALADWKGPFVLSIVTATPPANDTCATAAPLTLKNGAATAKGDTVLATDTVNLPASGCTQNPTGGPDVFYNVQLIEGSRYLVALAGPSSFNRALYVLTSCSSPAWSCGQGADSSTTDTEEVLLTAPTSGEYIIGVDGRSSSDRGSFTLAVTEVAKPANETCKTATVLALSGGKVSIKGDTTHAADDVQLTFQDCGIWDTQGPDLFYRVKVEQGKHYSFAVTQSTFNHELYLFGDCTDVKGSCNTAIGVTREGSLLRLIPHKTMEVFIGVDGTKAADRGAFTLTVTEVTKPGNDTCAAAAPVTLTGGAVSVSGDTTLATGTVDLPATGCTGHGTPGPDVFFQIDLVKDKTYKVQLANSGVYHSLFIFTSCGDPAATCAKGTMMSSSASILFTPPKSRTYLIGIDGTTAPSKGSFSLEITEMQSNDSCGAAQPLSLSSAGVAKVSGDLAAATDGHSANLSKTCMLYTTPGPDLFYVLATQAKKSYSVTVTPSATLEPVVYSFTSCGDPGGTCLACAQGAGAGKPGTITFSTPGASTVYIAVDTAGSWKVGSGTFALEVNELP